MPSHTEAERLRREIEAQKQKLAASRGRAGSPQVPAETFVDSRRVQNASKSEEGRRSFRKEDRLFGGRLPLHGGGRIKQFHKGETDTSRSKGTASRSAPRFNQIRNRLGFRSI